MSAYVDREFVYRFVTKPFADWWGRPRKAILGHAMRELLGEEQFAERKPLLDAILFQQVTRQDAAPVGRERVAQLLRDGLGAVDRARAGRGAGRSG